MEREPIIFLEINEAIDEDLLSLESLYWVIKQITDQTNDNVMAFYRLYED